MNITRQFKSFVIRAGSGNPLVQFVLRRQCRKANCRLRFSDDAIEILKDTRVMRIGKKHFVYAPDMAERFEMYFSPVVPTDRNGEQVVDYSVPRLQTYKSNGLQFELASFPEEDEAIGAYFRWYRPEQGDLVFDIGAHCGVSTYHFSKLVGPAGRVIAFEPDPLNYSLLVRNIERHQLSNVTAVDSAISASCGYAAFLAEGTIGSNLARVSTRDTVGSTIQVPTTTLRDAFATYGKPALCKIDIEGAELEVLEACQDLLASEQTNLVLDTNHTVGGALTTDRVERILRQCGYECASMAHPATTWARPLTFSPT